MESQTINNKEVKAELAAINEETEIKSFYDNIIKRKFGGMFYEKESFN